MKPLSVRFYKRLILLVLALLILIPIILAVFFGSKSARLEKQLGQGGPDKTTPVPASAEPKNSGLGLEGEPIGYQLLYPELYGTAEISGQRVRAANTVYLTFDCTPNANTRDILDVLDEYNVKATFFVSGTSDAEGSAILKEIADRGHTIGLRGYSTSYTQIYESVEAFLEDFQQIYDYVYDATGIKAEIFRFPAGSINSYNSGIYQELIAEMLRRNFVFFDWNVTGEDTTTGGITPQQVTDNVVNGMANKDRGIILLRDSVGKEFVTGALPGVIQTLQGNGYSFQPLAAEVLPVIFSYKSAP